LPGDLPSRFYPIVDSTVCAARGLEPRAVAEACLRAGVRLIQLRVKARSSAAFLALADEIGRVARTVGAMGIVNISAVIARMSRADGVHVGQEDLPADAVRRVLGRGLLGLSTHSEAQIDEALAGEADYVAVGPVYDTTTKDTGYGERGLALVRCAAGRGKPIVAIGGIDLARAPEVIAAGASAVAVITDLLSGDPEARARAYLQAIAQASRDDPR
jgi:thiamine-phosphate pyrophosphorylase